MSELSADVIVVGSGASGAVAAATLVSEGVDVVMVDYGNDDPILRSAVPDRPFAELRQEDSGQRRYLLGPDPSVYTGEGTGVGSQLTPPRQFLTRDVERLLPVQSDEFFPMQSLAFGGLGAGWGAACFTYTREELEQIGIWDAEFPQDYEKTASLIGVSGDPSGPNAEHVLGGLASVQPALRLDCNHRRLLAFYKDNIDSFRRQGLFIGPSALAVLSHDLDDRRANPYHDMDFYGDSRRSVFRPRYLVEKLSAGPRFRYAGGLLATGFDETPGGPVFLRCRSREGAAVAVRGRRLILCAGAINSARLALASRGAFDQPTPILCNPYFYVPCVQMRMLGRPEVSARHSLSQLTGVLLSPASAHDPMSLQFYSYGALLAFRLAKEMPLPTWVARWLVRFLQTSFVIVGAHHADRPGAGKALSITASGDAPLPTIRIRYERSSQETALQAAGEQHLVRLLRRLGCVPLKVVNPGAAGSIHYAGTLPSSPNIPAPVHTKRDGRIAGSARVFIGDSASWNHLPAKGLTLTLMANAMRVGRAVARSLRNEIA